MKFTNKNGKSNQALRLRLTGKLIIAAMVSLLLVEVAWLGGVYLYRTAHVSQVADRETRKLLSAAVDPKVFPTLTNEKAVIDRLGKIAHIDGARFEDTAGEPLATVGKAPAITVLEARRDNIMHRMSADRRYLDVYIPAHELRFSHPMIVRIDLASYYRAIAISVKDDAFMVFNIVVLTLGGLFIALYPILLGPLRQIRSAIIRGVNDLDIADSFAIKWSRGDEVGDLARAVNELLFTASRNYEEVLHTAHDIHRATSIASLAYSPKGELIYANPAALELFGASSVEILAARDQKLVRLAESPEGEARSFPEVAQDELISEEAHIMTPEGERIMLCIAGRTLRADGSLRRHTAQFLDLEQAYERMAKLAEMTEQASLRRLAADRRSLRLRVMLESCLTLINGPETEEGDYDVVDPEEVIASWAEAYAGAGKPRKILYNRLPPVTGNAGQLAILFRQVLSYAEFKSAYADTSFKVIAHDDGEMLHFEIGEVADKDSRPKPPEDDAGGALTLCRGAILRITNAVEGSFKDNFVGGEMVTMRLSIPQIAIDKSNEEVEIIMPPGRQHVAA